MFLKFDSITIENFMSFAMQELSFYDSGKVLVLGRIDESYVVSNGAGKSALFEALVWALYGKTVRNSPVSTVIRSGAKKCSVVLRFRVVSGLEEVSYQVERSRTKSGGSVVLKKFVGGQTEDISGSSVAETDGRIVEVVGLSYDLFINSVFYGQGLPYRFIQETDRGKKEILEEILDLSWLDEFGKRSRELQSIYRSVFDELGMKAVQLSSKIEALEKSYFSGAFEEDNVDFNVLVEELRSSLAAKNDILLLHEKDLNSMRASLNDLCRERGQVLSSKNFYENEKGNILRRKRLIESEDVLQCPVCFSNITDRIVREGISKEYERELFEVEKNLEIVGQKIAYLSQAEKSAREGIAKLEAVISNLRAKMSDISKDITQAEERLKVYQMRQQVIRNIRELEEERKRVNETKEKVEKVLSCVKFWVDASSATGIRMFIISKVLPFLNSRVNYYLSNFSQEYSLQFRASDNGEKIVTVVEINGVQSDYSQLSGGERRRFDVAVLLAFGDLYEARFNSRVSLKIFDEVCENLDASGIEAFVGIVDMLSLRSAVYLISHTTDIPNFERILRVDKINGISSAVYVSG